ncbi:MAG: CHAT domain-containing protein [Cyanobacteria bacterium P01_G01_bin.54]
MLKSTLCLGGTFALAAALPPLTLAQSIVPAADGTGTIVQYNDNTYHIEGGTQAGANLFHSFQVLGLSSGEIANFLSNPSITHILGRVTGGEPSVIDGLVQVTGANSNLYLMNPAGIVFGQGASLNVGGDFTATTSDRIGFANGWFNATGANDYVNLVGAPNGFAFASEQPGAILNFGALTPTQDVNLIAGTVLNQGAIASTSGNITIAAVPGERRVRIGEPGMLLSLEVEAGAIVAGIQPIDLPELLAGPVSDFADRNAGVSSASSLHRSPTPHSLSESDLIIAGAVAGQQIDLYAAGAVTPTDADLVQGNTRVTRFSATGENPGQAVFIDARANNPDQLLYGAEAGTVAQIIERDENGIVVISEQLAAISESMGELASVAIVAEGNVGNFWLGNEWIRAENIGDYAAQLQSWGEALTANADILLYSCFTALGETGEALVQSIADMTGADVAASVDATGSANYAANWDLEYSTISGSIEAGNPFTSETVSNWNGKLATFTVTDFTDGGGANTLRYHLAFNATNSGDTVIFASPATITLNPSYGSIYLPYSDITVDGNGGTVDGNGSSSVFLVSSAVTNTTIQNITIRNGSALYGGGIDAYNSNITLINSTLSGNSAGVEGGGIISYNGNITLINSTLSGNSAGNDGGGIKSFYGNITLINSTVSGNIANDDGAGIQSDDSNITLINSTVTGNSARDDGGGIQSDYGNITLNSSTVSRNLSGDNGGGIETDNGNVALINATVSDNSAINNGGGISAASVTIEGSTISGNSTGGNGGGIFSLGDVTVTDSNVIGNIASGYGGGIFGYGTVALNNSLVTANIALQEGNNICTAMMTATGPVAINCTTEAQTCEAIGSCEHDLETTDDEVILTDTREGTHSLDPGVEDVEADMTNDYDIFAVTDALELNDIQIRLRNIAQQTKVIPGLLYFTFSSATLAADPNAESLLASASPDLEGLLLSQPVSQQSSPGNTTDQLQVILVTPEGTPIIKSIVGVDRAQVMGTLRRLRRGLVQINNRYRRPAQQLYDWLIRPLEADLSQQGIQNLSIIADEGLRSLPIATLHDGEQFLIEKYSLGMMPSISLVDASYRSLNSARVLAMGASEFVSQSALPAVPTELELITQGQAQAPQLNAAFNVANLERQSRDRNFEILHLATHAVFQAGAPDQAYVQLWDQESLKLDSFRDLKFYTEPALELLILSACETALGDANAELGFAGSALQAGVKSVLASLWQVSDLGTLVLMDAFYNQLDNPDVTIKAEALRQAQLHLLQGQENLQDGLLGDLSLPLELTRYANADLTHPYYWSAFTLVGSPW